MIAFPETVEDVFAFWFIFASFESLFFLTIFWKCWRSFSYSNLWHSSFSVMKRPRSLVYYAFESSWKCKTITFLIQEAKMLLLSSCWYVDTILFCILVASPTFVEKKSRGCINSKLANRKLATEESRSMNRKNCVLTMQNWFNSLISSKFLNFRVI